MTDVYGSGYLYVTNALPNRTTYEGKNTFSIKVDESIRRIRLLQSFFPIYFPEKYISGDKITPPVGVDNIVINPKYNSTKKILVKINGVKSKNAFDLMIYMREQYSGNESPLLELVGGTKQLTFIFMDEVGNPLTREELATFYLTFATYDQ